MTRVLVTGAGGFIGGHLVDVLQRQGGAEVVATSQGSGARFARHGIPFHAGSFADMAFAQTLMEGVDAVVHCAFGPGADSPHALRQFLDVCSENGVKRFVHMSTVEVYAEHAGRVRETAPLRGSGADYGAVKAVLERVVMAQTPQFESVTVLRPAIVYGPASTHWIIRPIKRMVRGGWDSASHPMTGTCNPVHVTDLARVAAAAAQGETQGSVIYNVVGPEVVSWRDYYGRIAAAVHMGATRLESEKPSVTREAVSTIGRAIPRSIRRRILNHARGIPYVDLYADTLRRSQLINLDPLERELYNRDVTYATDALRKERFAPKVPFEAGMAQCLNWAKTAGILTHISTAKELLAGKGMQP